MGQVITLAATDAAPQSLTVTTEGSWGRCCDSRPLLWPVPSIGRQRR